MKVSPGISRESFKERIISISQTYKQKDLCPKAEEILPHQPCPLKPSPKKLCFFVFVFFLFFFQENSEGLVWNDGTLRLEKDFTRSPGSAG